MQPRDGWSAARIHFPCAAMTGLAVLYPPCEAECPGPAYRKNSVGVCPKRRLNIAVNALGLS